MDSKNQLSNGVISYLINNSTLTEDQINKFSQLKGKELIKKLLSYSTNPLFKNLTKTININRAPIVITPQYQIYLNFNKKYMNYFLSIIFRDLFVIDIDNKSLEEIEQSIRDICPAELFAIHETSNGKYHLIMLSNPIVHNELIAMKLRFSLGCDIDYAYITQQYGSSVRLISKTTGERYRYKHIKNVGNGNINQHCNDLYQVLLEQIDKYGCYSVEDFSNNSQFRLMLYDEWLTTIKKFSNNIGLVQIFESYPAFLVGENNNVIYRNVHNNYLIPNDDRNYEISLFLNRKFQRECESDYYFDLMDEAIRSSSFYWIIKSNSQYAIGVDNPVNFHFIVFKQFLMVDYDHQSRIKILYEFCRLNPKYKFRVCQTRKGWHAFLTSHKMPYNDSESINLLKRLGCDPLYIQSVAKKGYSVRLNRKTDNEKIHTDFKIVGTGVEIDQLVKYYELIQTLIKRYHNTSLINLAHINACQIFKEYYRGGASLPLSPPAA